MTRPSSVTQIVDALNRVMQSIPIARRRRIYGWVSRVGAVAGLLGVGLPLLGTEEILGVPVAPVVAGCLLISAASNRLARANT